VALEGSRSGLLNYPLIVGDGVHDDADGINALLRGEPVEFGPLLDTSEAGWRTQINFSGSKFHVDCHVGFVIASSACTIDHLHLGILPRAKHWGAQDRSAVTHHAFT